jgi:hypothetical protein
MGFSNELSVMLPISRFSSLTLDLVSDSLPSCSSDIPRVVRRMTHPFSETFMAEPFK